MIRKTGVLFCAFLMLASSLCAGELQFARYFSDNMVLQRDKPNVIRGSAGAGADVQISFAGQEKKARTDDAGYWEVTLDTLAANNNGTDLTVKSGGEKKVLKDVVVGDVILFGRQTTIDISLGRDETGKKAAAGHRKNPLYRAIIINMIPVAKPQADFDEKATAGWCIVDEASALKMSAAAYYLGRDLAESVDVPVGVVDLNMGCNFPISWLSREALAEKLNVYGGDSVNSRLEKMEEKEEGFTTGEPVGSKKRIIEEDPVPHPLYPSSGYNSVIHPLRGVGLKGMIMQIGSDYPYMYYERLRQNGKLTDREALNDVYKKTYDIRKEGFRMEPATVMRVPGELRKVFGDATLPFAFVQPPSSELWPYAVHNCEMRELQRMTFEADPSIGLILPGMEAIPFSGQQKDEVLLAERSLKWVLGAVYNKNDTPATGPVYERFEADGNKATVYYKAGTAKGLKAPKGVIDGFEAANVDAEYVPAKAVIDGETVKLTCDSLDRIFHVRYNYREKPDEGLVNSAGLPAIPFRTEKAGHRWLVRYQDDDLPEEYSTPASEWKGGAVTLVNGQLEKIGYQHFSGWLGPVGVKTGPFGPNMGVREVKKGSPADGRLLVGDVIYSANGKMLGDEEEMTMAAAITDSEARDGRLVLGVHRDGKNLDVEVRLEVMGSYSSTSPWNCLKTEKIVSKLEKYLATRGAPSGYLGTDQLFMLGAGSPEYQWMVRANMAGRLTPAKSDITWVLGYNTILMSEYYLSTGDKRILPAIKALVDQLAEMQIKEDGGRRCGGWYGRGAQARSYPEMVHCAISGMLGMTLAKECGVEVDPECYQRGLAFLERKGAPVGQIIYGDAFRSNPAIIDPEEMLAGKLNTSNGKVAEAAIFYDLIGDKRSAYINSLISTHSWYSTREGHGGNFWNDFWTPLGAAVHSRESYIYFMKHHRWYRECHRSFDGSLLQQDTFDGGCGLALVVPHHRLRILGAPKSPFSPGAPEALKPALAAWETRDYKQAETLATPLLADASLATDVAGTIAKLIEEAKRMQASISSDLTRIESLIKDGCLYEAGLMLATLTPVVAEGDSTLAAVTEKLKNSKVRENDRALYEASLKGGAGEDADEAKAESADDLAKIQEKKAAAAAAAAPARIWECLTPKEFVPSSKNKKPGFGETTAEQAAKWRLAILETRDNAPEGWMKPGFDDSGWIQTTQPISWHLNHIALFRTVFTVKDRNAFDLLRFRGWLFRQQDVEIYLNGTLIGRVNNLEGKTSTVEAEFKQAALDLLKDGENTLAIATRHNWRWGMLGMRVYNDGFDFMLDARLVEKTDVQEKK